MSFRARLTISYAIFAAVLLTLVCAVLVGLAMWFTTRPIIAAVEETARQVQRVVDADRGRPERQVFADVRAIGVPSGVFLRVNERRRFPGPPPGRHGGGDLRPFDLASLLGGQPHVIRTGPNGDVFVAPDLRQMRALAATFGKSFLVALALTLLAAWAIGRWITAQALAPLLAIAGELRRFAAGDFTPRVVKASDRSEIGQLVEAYDGAAAQVAAAFRERERVEEHMRRFLGEAGHEIRTPLTVISGYLDVLERAGGDAPKVRELALPTMRAETRRLRALVERLMTLARLEGADRCEPEPVDVVTSARDAIAHVTAARGGTVRLHAAGDHVVLAEPAEIYEAIVNLVDNAVKYGGGAPADVTISGDDGGTVVRVSDRGPGIGDADRARLFERFFRGEAAHGIDGSGLGLAIVARAAERSHGTVALESSAPGATTFRLAFPPYRAPERAPQAIVLG